VLAFHGAHHVTRDTAVVAVALESLQAVAEAGNYASLHGDLLLLVKEGGLPRARTPGRPPLVEDGEAAGLSCLPKIRLPIYGVVDFDKHTGCVLER
jgi:hypothetical protein